ncbi:hypothetical protein [Streptosporangium canum]|uniref:hypothetical protein n=1 Tax=Streptosporangium canum TaxID=324952 RepID=UPI0037A07317
MAESWRLSDQERIDLVRRLNLSQQEQQARGPLSPREREELDLLPAIRQPAQIDEVIAAAQRELATFTDKPNLIDYRQGVLDAISWARGERAEAPVSGQVAEFQPPTYNELLDEVSFVDDVSYRRVPTPMICRRRPRYSTGVGQTLLWLVGYVDDPPVH